MYIPHEIEIEALEKQVRELKQENNDMKRSMHEFVTAQKEITKFAKTYEPNGYY
jgi:archaellum component FlaC